MGLANRAYRWWRRSFRLLTQAVTRILIEKTSRPTCSKRRACSHRFHRVLFPYDPDMSGRCSPEWLLSLHEVGCAEDVESVPVSQSRVNSHPGRCSTHRTLDPQRRGRADEGRGIADALTAHPAATLTDLQMLVDDFRAYYKQHRPQSALTRGTPQHAFDARPKATPTGYTIAPHDRVRPLPLTARSSFPGPPWCP